MKKDKLSRREALQLLGLTGGHLAIGNSALQVLINSVIQGMAAPAFAQSTTKPRKHLFVQMVGAPPRWTYDLFLNPYSSTPVAADAMVGTAYTATNGRYMGTAYQTTKINNINAPWMWQFDVPAAGGGWRPMAELMNNMLSVRGIAVADFQHESAQVKAFLPLGASNSLVALGAQNSGTPIPALDVAATRYTFKSTLPLTPVRLENSGNMISTLLDPFAKKTAAAYNTKRAAMTSYIDQSLAAFQAMAKTQHPLAEGVFESQKGANQLIQGALGDLTTAWNTLLAKYEDIVKRGMSLTSTIPGVSDLPIGNGGSGNKHYCVYDTYITEADMRTAFQSAVIRQLAEHFAVAEFVLLNDISGSITIAPNQMFNVKAAAYSADISFDEHDIGKMVSLLTNTLYNRAFAGCMLELIDRLKAANLYNETVIDVRPEFGRYGRSDGSGSDHADYAGVASFYSGIIQGPMFLGNILKNQGYGEAANISSLGMKLDMGHMAAAIATLLRAPNPVTARNSFLQESNGKIVSLIENSKEV